MLLADGLILKRQGKMRTLIMLEFKVTSLNFITHLDTKDIPEMNTANIVTMMDNGNHYTAFCKAQTDGYVFVYWFNNGDTGHNILSQQIIFGELIWYVP